MSRYGLIGSVACGIQLPMSRYRQILESALNQGVEQKRRNQRSYILSWKSTLNSTLQNNRWFLTSSHRNIPNHRNIPSPQNPIAPNIPSPRNNLSPSIPGPQSIRGPIHTFVVAAEIDHVVRVMVLVVGFEGNFDANSREPVGFAPVRLGR